MERSLEREIREHLADYLFGLLSLNDFKIWLAGATWDAADADPIAIRLANRTKLALAEHSSGVMTDAELREELRSLLQHGEVVLITGAPPQAISASSSASITQRMTFPESVAGTARAWVSVS